MNRRRAVIVSSLVFLISSVARAQTGPAQMLKDINTGPTSYSGSFPAGFVECGGVAFFTAFTLETGRELWKSDGTEAGTVLVKDINPGPSASVGFDINV